MLAKFGLFILLILVTFATGSLQAQVPVAGCPQGLELLRASWGTTPELGQVAEVRAWLTFRNTVGVDIDFGADPYETLQIWSIPGGMDIGMVTFNASPVGSVVPPGENFSYDVTIDVAGLPLAETGLAFRPDSYHPGTLEPPRSELVSASFECVAGRRGSSSIPTMSWWSRIALLLVVVGAASVFLRRRYARS